MTGGRFSRTTQQQAGQEPVGELPPDAAPLGGTQAEATQRLQVGLFGLASMVLLVGLASIIGNQADLTEESAVPEAAPTTEPTEAPPQRDPLADAGIVPDLPAEPSPVPTEEVTGTPDIQTEDLENAPEDVPPQT